MHFFWTCRIWYFFLKPFDWLWVLFEILQHKPYLRYWFFCRPWTYDRPKAHSALSFEKESFLFKTRLGSYRSRFSSKTRTQGEKSVSKMRFMLIDLKIFQNEWRWFEPKKTDLPCWKKWAFVDCFCSFFFFFDLFRFPWVRTASLGCPGSTKTGNKWNKQKLENNRKPKSVTGNLS